MRKIALFTGFAAVAASALFIDSGSELNAADAEAALARFPEVYSPTVDGRAPIWAKRHGLA